MRAILDGKLYDTTTAREIAHHDAPEHHSASRTTLYQTARGAYFTVNGDTPLRGYHHGGHDQVISALTEAEARGWLEQYGTIEAYTAEFGKPEEA